LTNGHLSGKRCDMARKSRIHYPGACYHVILRGNAGHDIFFEDQDRSRFFLLLQEGIERFHHRIHAYCLMTNHVHLVMQVGEVPLSRILQNISFRYTRFINQRKNQTGHLFQGRYRALLLDADAYLLELVRYIHNNPVRAGIAKTPDEFPWSSHAVYLENSPVPWLTTDWVLAQFADKKKRATALYRQFILKGVDEKHRKDFYRGDTAAHILGDDHFSEKALAAASQKMVKKTSLNQVLRAVCKQYAIDRDDLLSGSRERRITEPRAVAALLVRDIEHLSLTALSRKLQRDLSGLSQAASRLDKKLKSDSLLASQVTVLRNLLL
jgi:putative transposase